MEPSDMNQTTVIETEPRISVRLPEPSPAASALVALANQKLLEKMPRRSSVASGSDDRILTYGDATLVQYDLSILSGPHYLNDRLIHFYFSYLASSSCSDNRILFVPPSLAFLISNYPDPTSLADVIAPLHLPDKALVLFPVNDNPDVTLAEGGSHWSLLICYVPLGEFVHHDSCSGMNRAHAQRLFDLVRSSLGRDDFRYIEGSTPQQPNSYDCGLYVMAIARCVCEWYCKGKNKGPEDDKEKWFGVLSEELSGDKVQELRRELLSLVLRLVMESDSRK